MSEAFLYRSSRGQASPGTFSAAVQQGLAPDGGLYVPLRWPEFTAADFADDSRLPEVAARLLAPFVAGDPLGVQLPAIAREAFDFPAPLVPLEADGRLAVLELFHGPSAAFKDFGARFLAACFARLRADTARPLTILVATSGDTGGAVAAAFHGRPGVEVAVLFP
jgi:threonine synthase